MSDSVSSHSNPADERHSRSRGAVGSTATGEPGFATQDWRNLVLLLLLGVAAMAFGWVGYYGSDDMTYIGSAVGWIEDFPFVGRNHWELRHTIVAPVGLSIAILGFNEFAFIAPMMAYGLGILAVTYVGVLHAFGRAVAALTVAVLATTPLFAIDSTRIVADVTELFYLVSSLWLFYFATRSESALPWLFAAGLAAGFAWLTRETSGLIVLFYCVLFVLGYRIPRASYFVVAAGFFVITGAEMVYFWALTGDPLYRLVTDFATHLNIDVYANPEFVAQISGKIMGDQERTVHGVLTETGNFSFGGFFHPALVVLVNEEFGLTYYLALPLLAWLLLTRHITEPARRWLRLLTLFAGLWFVFLWFRIGMPPTPRHFLVPTYLATLAIAAGIVHLVYPWQKWIAVVLLGGLFATNLLAISIDNRDPDYGERRLRDYLMRTDTVVHTDPETAWRGGILYRIAGVGDRVSDVPPASGDVFFANQKYLKWWANAKGTQFRRSLAAFMPQPGWQVIERIEPEQRVLGRIIETTGLHDFIPGEIWRRLSYPDPVVTIYRVP